MSTAYAQPRVSIGMPVYNGARFLEETLKYILAQTFTDFELIISDNASTDETETISRSYASKDRRIHYYRAEKNLGAAWNFNYVVELAQGEYFKWAAHDDLLAPEYLACCVEVLNREPEVILSYPQTIFINDDGEVIGNFDENMNFRMPKPHQRWRAFFTVYGKVHPIYGLIRTHILRQTALFQGYIFSDRVLLGELTLYGQFSEVPSRLFYRRLHEHNSYTTDVSKQTLANWYKPTFKRSRLILPKWRRLYEYFRAVTRAPIGWNERLKCYMRLAEFALVPKKWKGLIFDLLGAENSTN